jgi:hypothetical protein
VFSIADQFPPSLVVKNKTRVCLFSQVFMFEVQGDTMYDYINGGIFFYPWSSRKSLKVNTWCPPYLPPHFQTPLFHDAETRGIKTCSHVDVLPTSHDRHDN